MPMERPPAPIPPPTPPGVYERLARIVADLTLGNVVTIGLLMMVAVPVFIVWKLANDSGLRDAFLSSMRVQEGLGVPCLVMVGNVAGAPHRTVVIVAFETDGRLEFDIAVRSPGQMDGAEVAKACDEARRYRDVMRNALGSPSEHK